jgi:hypothetical protein
VRTKRRYVAARKIIPLLRMQCLQRASHAYVLDATPLLATAGEDLETAHPALFDASR